MLQSRMIFLKKALERRTLLDLFPEALEDLFPNLLKYPCSKFLRFHSVTSEAKTYLNSAVFEDINILYH